MRLRSLTLWDMRFQLKYGFLFSVYGSDGALRRCAAGNAGIMAGKVAPILIFSDPAAMGLFFMGAIILLEKVRESHWHSPLCRFVRWNM